MIELTVQSPSADLSVIQNQVGIDLEGNVVYENNYTRLTNKPKINNTELNGNISTDYLGIDYEHLDNKPDLSSYATQSYVDNHHDSTKQDAITSTNKLSADLLSDGTTNKLVYQSDKDLWNGKTSINDSSTSSTMETWSASKINTAIFGAMEASY